MGPNEVKSKQVKKHMNNQGEPGKVRFLHRQWAYSNCDGETTQEAAKLVSARMDTISGLKTIDKTFLPSRLKLFYTQFGLLCCIMWPLTIYKATWQAQGSQSTLYRNPRVCVVLQGLFHLSQNLTVCFSLSAGSLLHAATSPPCYCICTGT